MTKADKSRVKQIFSFKAPGATSVMLAGDFTDWQRKPISLQKQPSGIWTTTVSLSPGTYHYRFLVDGRWQDDPECNLRVPNPFGSEDAVLVVSAATKGSAMSSPPPKAGRM